MEREQGTQDIVSITELNKDSDRVQDAITALLSGKLHFPVLLL